MRSLVHTVTKNLAEHGEKLDDETKKTVQDAIDSAKTLDSSASVETLKVGHVWTAYAYDPNIFLPTALLN